MKIEYNWDTDKPVSSTTYNPETGKPDMLIKFKEDGVTPLGKPIHYDKEGNEISK